MNAFDYAVLFGSILLIAVYGILRTRGRRNLHDYLRGKKQSWFAIGLSVMATQASAITFLSTPGQGYADGMGFVQNYFALPLALVIIAAFFLPIYRKLNVYTAYEFLGKRFDKKTRLLAASIFLIQRALGAGYTLYAPAIVLSTVFGWSLSLTLIASGFVVIAYTVVGGSDAVTHTQKYQIAVIFAGMIAAFCILLSKIPCSFTDSLALAGHFGKLHAVDFSTDPKKRYTFWTGMLGGIFLMLSYFGTDQSQVQRYISGDDLRESRLGLMFNALFKIPMQFGILLLGVMLFVFYQFHPSPIFFNTTVWQDHAAKIDLVEFSQGSQTKALADAGNPPAEAIWLQTFQLSYKMHEESRLESVQKWLTARQHSDNLAEADAIGSARIWFAYGQMDRKDARDWLLKSDRSLNTNDNDYVFITFILDNLPHGLIGLLVACFFLAALSSKAAELNALASCSVIDFYRYLIHPPRGIGVPPMSQPEGTAEKPSTEAATEHRRDSDATADRHYVLASKAFTLFWGFAALFFALFLFTYFQENLIQATNIIGSIFYGVVLALFLIAFFIKFIHGNAAFYGALVGQAIVFLFVFLNLTGKIDISYLWYNLIGCVATICIAVLLQLLLGPPRAHQGFPVIADATVPMP